MPPNQPAGDQPPAAEKREISNAWIREHYPRIHRAAWLMTGDSWEAEDLAQDTFLIALDRWHSFQGRSSDATWLYGILIRLQRRRGRTLARMRRRWTQYMERGGAARIGDAQREDPNAQLAREEWQASVWADVAGLPSRQRIAVTLRFAEGMTYQQIGEVTGCAAGTAKTRVHHGLNRLKERFGKESVDTPPGRSTAEASSCLPTSREIQPAIEMTSKS